MKCASNRARAGVKAARIPIETRDVGVENLLERKGRRAAPVNTEIDLADRVLHVARIAIAREHDRSVRRDGEAEERSLLCQNRLPRSAPVFGLVQLVARAIARAALAAARKEHMGVHG